MGPRGGCETEPLSFLILTLHTHQTKLTAMMRSSVGPWSCFHNVRVPTSLIVKGQDKNVTCTCSRAKETRHSHSHTTHITTQKLFTTPTNTTHIHSFHLHTLHWKQLNSANSSYYAPPHYYSQLKNSVNPKDSPHWDFTRLQLPQIWTSLRRETSSILLLPFQILNTIYIYIYMLLIHHSQICKIYQTYVFTLLLVIKTCIYIYIYPL